MSPAGTANPSADPSIPRVLAGRYRLLRVVGHGGMGSVYEALHIHTEKRVAVKLLAPQLSKDLKLVARFRREAMAASRLEHENCVQVDDFGEDGDGTFYIAMELIEGRGLADELRASGPMSAERVAHIAVQLLKALDAAHTNGVLHRDLKPQNVMLTHKPQRPDLVKVVDFGIAKITTNTPEDQGALTVPGTIFGTPEYMSPEQARGEVLDHRSDLYSASVVLWHMLLGRSPFRGASVRETLMKVFTDEPPSPTLERPTLKMPPGFEQVLRRAMNKRREDRYPDAASFLEALRPFVTGPLVEIPRRALQGLPEDGSPPPITLDDSRLATVALPEQALPPLALPQGQLTEPAPASPEHSTTARVLGIDTVKRQTMGDAMPAAAPPPAEATSRRPRRRRLSRAAIVVLSVSGLGALLLAGVGAGVVYLVSSGKLDEPARVVGLGTRERVTNTGHDERRQKRDAERGDVAIDPVARDAAMAEAEQAFASGDAASARAFYEDALRADPETPGALIGVATIAMQQKDWAGACGAFEKVMALDAKYARQFRPIYARARKFRDRTDP